ncbi:hypothetical protein AUJ13_03615 [Candidatus Micrarchaeota archaeon CG1_02_49_24]|nr:MAG: hypothetical protein AUJ13_03615 [Candidatus Micrarchaeota archaeon CG1_02_49_24]HII53664.1 nucleotidyl transferase AbiEii/AbiGii toxin family protein [Candidatus Micrarchaeota archaeon]
MAELNMELCKAIAVQHGLPLQFVIKEFYVFDVLEQITAITVISKRLAFKGGTALSKVYLGKLQRFSEDLDFDSNTESIAETMRLCKQIAEKLTGYEIKEFRRVRGTIQFYCMYEGPSGMADHVRVDMSAKKILSAKPLAIKPAISAVTQRSVTGFSVYAIEDLAAQKLGALGRRYEGKDFYDVHAALPLCGALGSAITKMLMAEKIDTNASAFLKQVIQQIKKADYKKLRNLTNPYIPVPNRPRSWQQLKNDLILKLELLQEKI